MKKQINLKKKFPQQILFRENVKFPPSRFTEKKMKKAFLGII